MKSKINIKNILDTFSQDYSFTSTKNERKTKVNKNEKLLRSAIVGAEKYDLLHSIYLNAYGSTYENISEDVKSRYFNKLFNYINQVDFSQQETVLEVINELSSSTTKKSLNRLLYYFQDIEEYEKCATIKKFLDLTKK